MTAPLTEAQRAALDRIRLAGAAGIGSWHFAAADLDALGARICRRNVNAASTERDQICTMAPEAAQSPTVGERLVSTWSIEPHSGGAVLAARIDAAMTQAVAIVKDGADECIAELRAEVAQLEDHAASLRADVDTLTEGQARALRNLAASQALVKSLNESIQRIAEVRDNAASERDAAQQQAKTARNNLAAIRAILDGEKG